MHTQKIKVLGLLAAALLATGCLDNPLNLDNPNQRTTEAFWITEADAISAMDAVYRTLLDNGLYGRNRYWMWGRSDLNLSRSPASNIQNAVRGIFPNYDYGGFLDGIWEDPYRGIFRANQVITEVPEMEDLDAGLAQQLVAEARFIRGLYHFENAVMFGDIPIILEVSSAGDQPSFQPVSAVYDQVISDAMAAADVLPWTWSGEDTGRATRGGALALAAEAHMMKQEWGQAVPLLQQIVDSGQYSLIADYGALFRPEGENVSESIFEAQFGTNEQGSQGARGNVNPRLVAPSSGLGSSIGFNDIQPTDYAFEQFFVEGSFPDNPDPRLEASMFWDDPAGEDVFGMDFRDRYATTGPNGQCGFRDNLCEDLRFIKKYQEYYLDQLTNFANPLNIKIYRYGKVLMMLAEALNESGNPGAAATPLNMVRARVGLGPVPPMNQQEMDAWIDREYILELYWEVGTRIQYLKRQGKFNKAFIAPRNEFHGNAFVDGKSELLPVDQDEIDRNPNAVQNPGW